tara:strand:- start:316 stop:534 length:219 start_codon:yes stop_codon:yes gene_type:complete
MGEKNKNAPLAWGRDVQARAHGGAGAQLQMELNDVLEGLRKRGLTKERAKASIATVFYGHGTPVENSNAQEK